MGLNRLNRITERQIRLRVILPDRQLDLVPSRDRGPARTYWAWPGGSDKTYGEIARLCRARGWPQPELVEIPVRRRAEESDDES